MMVDSMPRSGNSYGRQFEDTLRFQGLETKAQLIQAEGGPQLSNTHIQRY